MRFRGHFIGGGGLIGAMTLAIVAPAAVAARGAGIQGTLASSQAVQRARAASP